MPLDPILEPLLAQLPPAPEHIDDFPAYRLEELRGADAIVDLLVEPAPEGAERRVERLEVEGGTVDLHIFTPKSPGPHPAHLYLHGGGWVGGTIKQKHIDILCTERSVLADCVVITVEYRKAPEHKFPTGLDDCYAALVWVDQHADDLGIRRDLITVGGGSAGANLAAAVALKARDENGPALALQLLEVPALDLRPDRAGGSFDRNATGYGLTAAAARMCLEHYLTSPQDARNPYASPLLAEDLSGLPDACILSAEYDPLADDGSAYADRLNAAGGRATFALQAGQIHMSSALTKILPAARAWRDIVIDALRSAHQRPVTEHTGAPTGAPADATGV